MYLPSLTLLSVLLLIGSAQACFQAVLLLTGRKTNIRADRFLAALLFVLSLSLLDGFLSEANYYVFYPSLIGLEWPTNFLYGPLIYLYIRSVTQVGSKSAEWKTGLHFIPTLISFILLLPFFLLSPDKKALWRSLTGGVLKKDSLRDLDPIITIIVVQMTIYLLLSFRLLVKHTTKTKQDFSSVEEINLSWLWLILITFSFLWAVYVCYTVLSPLCDIYRQVGFLLHLMCACAVFVLGYKGLKQPEMYPVLQVMDSIELLPRPAEGDVPVDAIPEGAVQTKYRKSSLDEIQAGVILDDLIRIMETERPYLEMELSLSSLAGMLSVSTNHLSQVINQKLKKSFFDFVNEYRVEEVKRLLLSPESAKLSVIGIGMDAGFRSKSAFYSAFKRHTGMTPTRYRKVHNPASR